MSDIKFEADLKMLVRTEKVMRKRLTGRPLNLWERFLFWMGYYRNEKIQPKIK